MEKWPENIKKAIKKTHMLHNKYAFDIIKKIGYYRDKLKTKTKNYHIRRN